MSQLLRTRLSTKVLLLAAALMSISTHAGAALVDANFTELSFSGTPVRQSGTDKQAGAIYKYTNVITVDGTQVNALVSIDEIHNGASIVVFDRVYSDERDRYFAPEISGGGSSEPNARIDFVIRFVDTNDNAISVSNFRVNSVDIDGPEFVEYGGFVSYVLSSSTDLQTTAGAGNRIRFTGTSGYDGLMINDRGRVQTQFDDVQSIQITMGTVRSSSNRQFGSIFKGIAFDGASNEISAPTVDAQSTQNVKPTITGTLAALSGSDTFTVLVNGETYTDGDGNLSVSGTTWSLTIPDGNELSPGTYDVVATRTSLIALPDQTVDELIITAPSNTAPVAVGNSYTINEAGTLSGNNLLGNDTDTDNDTLTAIAVSQPSNGTLTLNTDGSFSYTHDGSETTSDSFTYKANDGALDSNTVTVTISVTAVNDEPIAQADSYTVSEGETLTAASVLVNDNDAENDNLSAIEVSAPAYGTLTLNIDGTFTYVNNGAEQANDSFTYKANDGSLDSNIVTVSISITLTNDAPIALADTASVDEDGSVIINVVGNDSDADGTLVSTSLTIVSDASNGATQVNLSSGQIT